MRQIFRCGVAAVAGALLSALSSPATEHAANGWQVKKYSQQVSTACSNVVRYYVVLTRTGPTVTGDYYIVDSRSAQVERYINSSIVVSPPVPYGLGDTNNYLMFFPPAFPPGQTLSIQYDVQLKSPLAPGMRIRNYLRVAETQPSNFVYVAYDIYVKLGNGHARRNTARAGEPVNTATGEFVLPAETDLDLGGPLPVRFTRWYGSALNDPAFDLIQSALGRNWMHNYEVRQVLTGSVSRFVYHNDGKIVAFNQVSYTLPTPSNAWARNFEQEPVPYELKSDGNASGTNYWFMDPEQELVYRFDNAPMSLVREIQDRNGNAVLAHRRADGLVTNVTDGLGRNLYFEYGASSNLLRVTDGTRTISFGQDPNRWLVAFTNALGGATRYTYDATNSFLNFNGPLMTAVQHPRGNTPYAQTYNTNGQVTAQADAYGNNSTFEYSAVTDGWTQVTDPAGSFTPRHYDSRLLTNLTDQAGNALAFTYSEQELPTGFTDRRGFSASAQYDGTFLRPTNYVDGAGRTTVFSYVSTPQVFTNREAPGRSVQFTFGDLAAVTHPDGTTEQFLRDGRGNITSYVDRAGAAWTFTFNERGQVLEEINPAGGTVTCAYNADGTLASASNSNGGAVTFGYDALRRRVRSVYPDGAADSWGLDALDRITAATNANGQVATLDYDANSVLSGMADPAGRIWAHLTDLLDRRTNTSDNLGVLRTATYDAMGRLATETDPAGTTAYGYDLRGWRTSASRGGRTWQWAYDPDGFVSNEVSPMGRAVTYRRDAAGSPTEIVDALSRTSSLAYDVMERLVSARDPLGHAVSFGYDAAGRLSAVTNPLGAAAAIERDARGLPARATDFDGNATRYGYDPLGRLTAVTNPLGQVTRFGYDTSDRLTRLDLPDGTHLSWDYDAMNRVRAFTDGGTNAWTYGYDAMGRLTAETNPALGVARFAYNVDGTLDSALDSDTGPVSNRYDAARRLVETILPGGASYRYDYGTNDELLAATDPNGRATRYEYDLDGRLAVETDPLSNQTRYAYDAAGQLTGLVDRAGGLWRYAYDAAGRLTRSTDPTGLQTDYGYDDADRPVTVTLGGRTWRAGYNASGFPTSSVTPLGRANAVTYDAAQQPASETDPSGAATTYARDGMGRLLQRGFANGRSESYTVDNRGLPASAGGSGQTAAQFEHNALGWLSRLTDSGGRAWTFEYSAMGAPAADADPLGRTNRYARDARGQVVTVTCPDGSTASRSYDPAGNLTGAVYSAGGAYRYAYDALDRLTEADGVRLQYDAEGRITNTISTADGRAFSATYDAAGRLVSAGYDNGAFRVGYAYDPANGLLTAVTDSVSGASVTFSYDDDFRLTGLARGNGTAAAYEYDAAGRVTRIADGAILDLRYFYDAAGLVTGAVSVAPVRAMDGLATAATSATYDAAAQVSSPGYGYDALGRLTNAPGHRLGWNGASRLTGINGAALAYDGLNELVTRTETGVTTRFYYNRALGLAPIVAERNDTAGQFVRYYVWTPDGVLLYQVDVAAGNKPRYGHFDRMGSTLALTDESGAVADAYAYTPFGLIAGRLGSSRQPFTFLGALGVRQEGNSGALYQMRERYYDASLGRFVSREALWPQLDDAQKLNPYQYAHNQPVGRADPTGLDDSEDYQRALRMFGTNVLMKTAYRVPTNIVPSTYGGPYHGGHAPHPVDSIRIRNPVVSNYLPPPALFPGYRPGAVYSGRRFGAFHTPSHASPLPRSPAAQGITRRRPSQVPWLGRALDRVFFNGTVLTATQEPDLLRNRPFQPAPPPEDEPGTIPGLFGSNVLADATSGFYANPRFAPLLQKKPKAYCHQAPRNTSPVVGAYIHSFGGQLPRGTSQLFGVDTIAIDPSGSYLYVANPTVSGGLPGLSIIDLTVGAPIDSVPGRGIPTGIAFSTLEE